MVVRDDWRLVHGPSCPVVPTPPIARADDVLPPSLLRTERGEDGIEVRHRVRLRAVDVEDGGAPARSARLGTRVRPVVRTRSHLVAASSGQRVAGPVRRLSGTAAVLDLRGRGATFGHWMIDALPNLWLLEQAGFPLDRIDMFLVPRVTPWISSSLAAAGITSDRVVAVEGGSLDVDRLLLPVRPVGSRRVPWWTVRGLTLDGRVTIQADPLLPAAIYVRRGSAGRRGVADEEQVVAALEAHGIVAVDPGDADLLEQRRRFASAHLIVAAHGAALTSLAWCAPGSILIELMPTARPNALFLHLAHQAGARYSAVPCEPSQVGQDDHGDIAVDIRALETVIARAGQSDDSPS
jgi:capsular polysaccharide biosynthesis protein